MEIKKEKLSWMGNFINKKAEIDTDLDVIVPDIKPDIKKILQIDANVDTTNCEVQNDRILVCGNVYFNVIYLPDDTSCLQSIRITAPFTDVIAVNGVTMDMECYAEADILSLNYKIINGRKFSIKSVVEAILNVYNKSDVELISGLAESDAQVRGVEIDVLRRGGRISKKIVINEKISVPDTEAAIKEVLNVSANVNEHSVKLINNKAIVKGNIKLNCIYSDAVKNEIAIMCNIVPFTEIIDIDGVRTNDLFNAKIETKACEYNCFEVAGGEIRGVETKTILSVDIITFNEMKYSVVSDCYSVNENIDLSTKVINVPRKLSTVNYSDTIKTNVSVKENDPIIDKIYDVYSKAYIDSVTSKSGKLKICGVVDNYVMYLTLDNEAPIYCIKNEVEFCEEFDCDGNSGVEGDFVVEVTGSSYVLNSDNNVELRLNLSINGIVFTKEELNVVSDVKASEFKEKPENASITVYFVQNGDTLWDIAKKYLTTVDAITKINEISENEICTGTRLLIPKYKKI